MKKKPVETGCLFILLLGLPLISPARETVGTLLLDLRYNRFEQALAAIREEQPAQYLYYRNYRLFLEALIAGDEHSYLRYTETSGLLTGRLNELAGDDPSCYDMLSVMHLQSSVLDTDHERGWRAFRNFYAAWRTADYNARSHPEYIPGMRTMGVLELFASLIPDERQWMIGWTGIRGTVASGRSKLEAYFRQCGPGDRSEAIFLLCLMHLQFDPDPRGAHEFMDSVPAPGANGLLYGYFRALSAMKAGENDAALEILSSISEEAGQRNFPYVHLLLGEAKLNRLDPESGRYLELFLEEHKGLDYIKLACHKLSWSHLLAGDTAGYRVLRSRTLATGRAMVEADRKAAHEAADEVPVHPVLLKARLLCDGGYYRQGIDLLSGRPDAEFRLKKDRIERHYRLARLFQGIGDAAAAFFHFQEVVAACGEEPWSFGPNAMLQMGLIAEGQGRFEQAASWYRAASDAGKKLEFDLGTEIRARAGLVRVGNYRPD